MRESKLYLENLKWKGVELGGYIPSKSDPDTKHFVSKRNGKWECDCIAGQMRRECSHVKKMAEQMNESHKCFYCGTSFYAAGGLDQHHVYRRSTHPELADLNQHPENRMLLCRRCHDRVTSDPEFEENLQIIWSLRKLK